MYAGSFVGLSIPSLVIFALIKGQQSVGRDLVFYRMFSIFYFPSYNSKDFFF